MKIGRGLSHVNITFDDKELEQIGRKFGRAAIMARGHFDATNEKFILTFGGGYTVRKGNTAQKYWSLAIGIEESRAHRVEPFGMTPTVFDYTGDRTITIDIPDVTAALRQRRMRTIDGRKVAIAHPSPPRVIAPLRPAPNEDTRYVSDVEMMRCKEIFNRAIERGFQPQYDARGRILFFDRRVE